MKHAPLVISQTNVQNALEEKPAIEMAQLLGERFPLTLISEQNHESDVLLLGSGPAFLMLGIIVTFLGIRMIKFVAGRNEIGVSMRS